MTQITVRSEKFLSSRRAHLEQQAQAANGISMMSMLFSIQRTYSNCFEHLFAMETVLTFHHVKRMDSYQCIPSYSFKIKSLRL